MRLGRLDLLKKRLLAQLAVPTFDRVAIVHAVVNGDIDAASWVDAVATNLAALHARAPGSTSTRFAAATLRCKLAPLAARLPIASLVIGGERVERQ